MKVLVLWADPGQENLGVRALAEGGAALIRRAFPEADVRIRGAGPAGDGPMSLSHITPLVKARLKRDEPLTSWMSSFDFVLDLSGGDSFADIYGVKRLYKMAVAPLLFRQVGVPVILGPLTIGPFSTVAGRLAAQVRMRSAHGVMARDTTSAAAAERLGRAVDLTATDVVFALEQPTVRRSRDVILNVSGLLWFPNPHVDHQHYRHLVRAVADGLLAARRRVTLLAHVLPVERGGSILRESDVLADGAQIRDDDVPAVAAVAEYLHHEHGVSPEVVLPTSLGAAREVISSAQVLIGARMHACLNALSCGVPAVPMAYSRKFAPLMEDLGWGCTVDIAEADGALRILHHLADGRMSLDAKHVRQRADAKLDPAIAWLREHAVRR